MARFSRPVIAPSTAADWPASPMRRRTAIGSSTMSWPATRSRPASGLQQGGHGADERGLAGSVGPEDGHNLAGGDGQVQAVEGPDLPEVLGEAVGLDEGAHRRLLSIGGVRSTRSPTLWVLPRALVVDDRHRGQEARGRVPRRATSSRQGSSGWSGDHPLPVVGPAWNDCQSSRPSSPSDSMSLIRAATKLSSASNCCSSYSDSRAKTAGKADVARRPDAGPDLGQEQASDSVRMRNAASASSGARAGRKESPARNWGTPWWAPRRSR